jgi:hypothetical protein
VSFLSFSGVSGAGKSLNRLKKTTRTKKSPGNHAGLCRLFCHLLTAEIADRFS